MWLLYDWLDARETERLARDQPATRLQSERPTRPPDPVLQGSPGSRFELADPVLEMEEMRELNEARLTSTGWVDRNRGVIHIPIEEAKQLLLQRGLPARRSTGGSR